MPNNFPYEIFLSRSAKDKAVVQPLAERMRQDDLKPKAEYRRQKEKWNFSLQHSSFSLSSVAPWRNSFMSTGVRRTGSSRGENPESQ